MSDHLAKISKYVTTIVFDGDALRNRKIDLAEQLYTRLPPIV